MAPSDPLQNYLTNARQLFQQYRELAERAMADLGDEEIGHRIDPESNSIATLMQHMGGNLLSRWTDFLTTDGEKASRNRDAEFEDDPAATRAALFEQWNLGWQALFHALDDLSPADLGRSVTIRGQPHTVVEAINRQLTHYAYHVGQIVVFAKHLRGPQWQTLSIPRRRPER